MYESKRHLSLILWHWDQRIQMSEGLKKVLYQAQNRKLIHLETVNRLELSPTELEESDISVIILPALPQVLPSEVVAALENLAGECPIVCMGRSNDFAPLDHHTPPGLIHFLPPPYAVTTTISNLRAIIRSFRENQMPNLNQKLAMRSMVGQSPAFRKVLRRTMTLAAHDISVLISGETGTGKEVCARSLHYLSKRARGPFIPINCGAVPASLIENELFGHVKGAYTGAEKDSPGLVAAAARGTLFLDEVDSLPPAAQVKLLRFLQEHEYRPVGGAETKRADVRILAASNQDLQKAVDRGQIRSDLFFRLNVVPIHLPPLRDRFEDILPLAHHFLKKCRGEFKKPELFLNQATKETLVSWHWPGNIRELEHVLRRAAVLCEGKEIKPPHLELSTTSPEKETETLSAAKSRVVANFEKNYICRALARHEGNITHAARSSGKNRRAFFELIRKHHINPETFRTS